jgi:hypothetical protein
MQRRASEGRVIILRDITERVEVEKEREELIAALQKALTDVRQLSGLLPICARCKKIRDDKGYWTRLEEYIHRHSSAEFTHGICPDCMEALLAEDEEPPGPHPPATSHE